MSECKHSFNLSYGKYCKICGLSIVDAWNLDVSDLENERDELQAQVKERELTIEKIEAKCCQCHMEHVSQVAVLRGALESLVKIYITNKGTENQFVACITPPHGTPAYWKNAINALDSTPSEASERVNALVGGAGGRPND